MKSLSWSVKSIGRPGKRKLTKIGSTASINLEEVTFKIFIGSWCSDSQREVPRLYKIYDFLDIDENKLQFIALDNHPDRYKQSPQQEEEGWNIEYVPTIIILKNGSEIGRIVESPMVSLEEDIKAILEKVSRVVS